MKKYLSVIIAAAIALGLASCGKSAPFAKLAGILDDYSHDKYDYEQQLKAANTGSEYDKIEREFAELRDKTRTKLEDAARKLDGYTLDVADNEYFTVKEPVKLNFRMVNSYMEVIFDLTGRVVAKQDITLDDDFYVQKDGTALVYILGAETAGSKSVGLSQIGGEIAVDSADGRKVIKAGTPVELQSIALDTFSCDCYPGARVFTFTVDDPMITL